MRPLKFMSMAIIPAVVFAALFTTTLNASKDDNDGGRKTRLSGFNEVPAVSSTGSGEMRLRIDKNNDVIHYELSYEDLEGTTTTGAHIHLGQAGVNGGVIAHLCGGDKPACTPTSGSFEGTIEAQNILGPAGQGIAAMEFAEVVRAIRAGVVYANVHSNKHPGGEIRGQIGH